MSEIFVTGHRNPDTDSIVASMAYAALRNALGDRDYKAVRIGSVNDETLHILDYFGFDAPMYVHNMRTQVRIWTMTVLPNWSTRFRWIWHGAPCATVRSPPCPLSTRTAPCSA